MKTFAFGIIGAIAYITAVCTLSLWLYTAGTDRIAENGAAACRAGVPAHANPYRGHDSMSADLWLRGWISAKNSE